MSLAGVLVSQRRRRVFHAHPTDPWQDYDWPIRRRLRLPVTVVGVLVVLAAIGAVLVLGALAGAVLGVDMQTVPA